MTIEVTSLPPPLLCTPSSTRPCSALLCCCPSVLFASVCCTSVYQQSRFDVALRAPFPSASLSFSLALFLQFLTAQLVRERERGREGKEVRLWGMQAQLQLIAAAKPAGPISGDLWTDRQCNTLTLPLPLPLYAFPPGTSNTFFSTHIFYRRF